MSLVKCKECGHEISTTAETYPNCGVKQSEVIEKAKNPKRVKRGAMHTPHGILVGYLLHAHPISGVLFLLAFLVYEIVEDEKIGDCAYVDIIGTLIGFATYEVVTAVVKFIAWIGWI